MNEIYLIERPDEGCYSLYFYNSPALAYYMRKIPTATYNEQTRCWTVASEHKQFVTEFCDFAKRRHLVKAVHSVDDE